MFSVSGGIRTAIGFLMGCWTLRHSVKDSAVGFQLGNQPWACLCVGRGGGRIGEAVVRQTVHCWICRCDEANDPVMVSKTILIVNTNIQQSFEIIMCWYHSRVDGTILADGI